jgi:hypothetical protein
MHNLIGHDHFAGSEYQPILAYGSNDVQSEFKSGNPEQHDEDTGFM